MKDLFLLLAAVLFIFTSCAPAADTAPAAPAADPTATPEAAAEPAADLEGELDIISHHMGYVSNAFYEVLPEYDGLTPIGTSVYKSDFSTGKTTLFYHTDSLFSSLPFTSDDTLYLINQECVLARPMNGGDIRELPFDGNTWYGVLYSDRYLYCLSADCAPFNRTKGMRFDLQTGETEAWNIPEGTLSVLDVVDGAVLIDRIVSDYPLPLPDDVEMSNAILQNAQYEYDLMDAASGKIMQKILSLPYYGEKGKEIIQNYYYLGKSGTDTYFWGENTNTTTEQRYFTTLCIHSDGTQEDLGLTVDNVFDVLYRGSDIQWLMVYNYNFTRFTIYDLQGNEIGQSRVPSGINNYHPLRLLDDGRILLRAGFEDSGANKYATIDADAFLNGSTEYTEMEFVG